ncbi:hypothetical protein [Pseudomonas phage D6]|nr:hypothetical protein [Pseudomonas phage D6]
MSTFTRFTADEHLVEDAHASAVLGKTYWRVTQGFRYYIGHEGSDKYVDVPVGFLTDGASVPFFLQWLIPPRGEYSQACTLHDWLCEHYEITQVINGVPTQVKIDREEIDRILYEAMRVLNVAAWRRNVIQVGVDAYRIVTRPTKPKVDPRKTELERGENYSLGITTALPTG